VCVGGCVTDELHTHIYYLFIYISIYLFICVGGGECVTDELHTYILFIYLSIYLSIYLFIYLFVWGWRVCD